MNSQNLILIGVGIFIGLIVTVAAVDQYMMSQHNPMTPSGLIWRVQTAFDRVKDLEAVIDVEGGGDTGTVRLLLRFVRSAAEALSVRYLDPSAVRGELFLVNRDLLSHYIPQDNVIIVKRWSGFPLANIGLSGFSLEQLSADYAAGRVRLKVVRDETGFGANLFPTPIEPALTISGRRVLPPLSLIKGTGGLPPLVGSFSQVQGGGGTIRGDFVLEVFDHRGALTRMIWIDPETYLVNRVVQITGGKRAITLTVERMTINQGLTASELMTLPRGVKVIHG